MKIEITSRLLENVLPQQLITVDEESSLADKVAPHADASLRLLQYQLLGAYDPDPTEAPDIMPLVEYYVAFDCVIKALPAIDVVVTPSGLAVISTDTMAPASKERIERLLATLRENRDDVLMSLSDALRAKEEWRATSIGQTYCTTFLGSLRDISVLRDNGSDLYGTYTMAYDQAFEFENRLATLYLGRPLIDRLRRDFAAGEISATHPTVQLIRRVDYKLAWKYIRHTPAPMTPGLLWHTATEVVRALEDFPELLKIHQDAPGARMKCETFRNKTKGGFFF